MAGLYLRPDQKKLLYIKLLQFYPWQSDPCFTEDNAESASSHADTLQTGVLLDLRFSLQQFYANLSTITLVPDLIRRAITGTSRPHDHSSKRTPARPRTPVCGHPVPVAGGICNRHVNARYGRLAAASGARVFNFTG
jgi:hypothetical protein